DSPARQDAAAAAAGNEEIVRVDVALGHHSVHAAVQVIKIVAGIRVMNEVGKLLAVAGAPARICVQHHVTHGSPNLLFKVEAVAIIPERPTVNLQNERVFLGGVEVWRMNDPTLNLSLVL